MEVKNFEVEIDMPEKYDTDVYTDGKNCYLAQALKKMFPESKIEVSCIGMSKIDGSEFIPSNKTPFDSLVCRGNLGKKFKIKMELTGGSPINKIENSPKYQMGIDPVNTDNFIITENGSDRN